MKLLKTLMWLLSHPPTNITTLVPFGAKCDYCGAKDNLTYFGDLGWGYCHSCMRKALDKALKTGKGVTTNGKASNKPSNSKKANG